MHKPPMKHYVVAEDLRPYLHPLQPWGQQAPLPNLEEITDPKEALREIAWSKANVDYYNAAVMLPPKHPAHPNKFPEYCDLFLKSTPMGGGWDGSGIILTTNEGEPRVFRFALCNHEKTEQGHSPNHGRGWHPGHCKHCGMNMTVDSGD